MQRKATDIFKTRLISLNSETAVQTVLRAKLEEYRQRLNLTTSEIDPDPTYKWYLLNELLTKGSIDILTIEQMFALHYRAWHKVDAYWNAVAVIAGHNTGHPEGMFWVPMATK